MEQNTAQNDQKLKHRMPLPKNRKSLVIIASAFLAVGVIVALIYSYFYFIYNAPPAGFYAVLGDQKITNDQFKEIYDAYLKFDESNAKDGAKVDKKQVERKVADEVLMRLSLQAEAEKRNAQKCTDDIINGRLKDRFAEAGGEKEYYNNLNSQYGWTKEVTKHKECLGFYEETLAKSVIGSVDLFGIYIRWDIAKGAQNQPADIQQKVDDYAKKRLETEYLPMFERGDSIEQISSKADIDPATVTQEQFDARVLNIDRSPSRVLVLPEMNRATYSEFQQYEEGESELPYFENLKVGENTKPFKSKTGYWVIYRATGRTDAPYQSLEALRADYLKKGKVAKSYYRLPKPIEPKEDSDPTRNFSLSAIDKIKNALVPTANAVTENSIRCFTGGTIHNLPMTIKYKDKATGLDIQTSGAYPGPEMFSTTNVQFPCSDEPNPAAYANYGVLVEYFLGAVAIKPAAIPAPTWNFGLSCYTGWDFRFKAPNGYNALTVDDYKDASRFYLNLQYASSTVNGNYASGSTKVDEKLYRIPTSLYSGIANGAKGFTITVNFTKTPVNTNGTLTTTKMFFGKSSDNYILASGSTLQKGQSISSTNGRYQAKMQNDGNFVVTDKAYNKPVFQTCTYANNPCSRGVGQYAGMTADGRFAIFDSAGNVVLDQTPQGTAGSKLHMQNDGNLVIWNSTTTTFYWSSGFDKPDGIAQSSTSVPEVITKMPVEYLDFVAPNVPRYSGTSNPFTVTTLVQADGYKVRFTVPTGYRLVSAFGSQPDGSFANGSGSNISCTGPNNTGTCTKSGINIRTGKTFNLDLVFQLDAKGSLDDVCNKVFGAESEQWFVDRSTTKAANSDKSWGWVYDPSLEQTAQQGVTPSKAKVVFDEGKIAQVSTTKLANEPRANLVQNDPTLASIYHSFLSDLPLEVFDAKDHTAKLYLEKDTESGTVSTFIESLDFNCGPDKKYLFPWLETMDGNVVADGKIIGQKLSNGSNFPGAREETRENKEVEFLIISALASTDNGTGPFCSTYNYILTNLYATDNVSAITVPNKCKTGAGYNLNSVSVNSGSVDRVIGGVKQSFSDNGSNANSSPTSCNANGISTATISTVPSNISTDCVGGLVYKLNPGTLGSTTVDKGRVTIFVDGNLDINGNILYGTTAQSNPTLTPNLAIVVNGNVNIRSDVTNIGAQIYASGRINTCAKNASGATASANDCAASRLGVYGGLASKGGYDFRRTYVNETFRTSAEEIRLSGQAFTFPPPGTESRYFYDDADGYSLDSAEYDPRF